MRTIERAAPHNVQSFLAVVESRSFRGAAAKLGIPKSTLSSRVQELEESLGTQLLVRSTRSIRLTEVGETFYREASLAMEALRAASARVLEQSEVPRGRVRMTAPFELGQRFMGGVLSTFALRFPEVRVELDLTDRQVNLIEEGYDLALRVGPLPESTLVARRVGSTEKQRLYASPAYLESFGKPERPADLKEHRCLVKSGRAWSFRVGGRPFTLSFEPHLSVNSFLVLAELAEAGVGIASLPQTLVEELKLNLVGLLEAYESPERECFLVYPSARANTPAVRALVNLVLEEYSSVVWARAKCSEALARCPSMLKRGSSPRS
jgi:DNA-binding transcriptional LysR family regulator